MSKIGERLIAIQQSKEKSSFSVEGLGENGQPLKVYYSKLKVREDEKLRDLFSDPRIFTNSSCTSFIII